jgi:hypothetical protein
VRCSGFADIGKIYKSRFANGDSKKTGKIFNITNHRIQYRTSAVLRVAKLKLTLTIEEPLFGHDGDPAANAMQLAIAHVQI